jgi:hypothetical protein
MTHYMKKIYTRISFLILFTIPLLYGCEKQEIMMSKETIGKQLSYTWTKLFTPAEIKDTWQFDGGTVYIRQNETLRAQGTYTIDCSLTKVKVKIAGLPTGFDHLNLTWQVISLDDAGLVIVDKERGVQEYEFVRKN